MGTRVAALPTRRSRRVWLLIGGIAILFVLVRGLVAWSDWRDEGTSTKSASTATLPARTVDAGAVTVKLEPTQLDANGAVIKVSFDTHSVDLGFDVARQARLVVNGNAWPAAGWSGDGPGGHHRAGELRFTAAGPANGSATLTIGGLPKPVAATWRIGG